MTWSENESGLSEGLGTEQGLLTQKAAEHLKAQEQPGQALLLFQLHVLLPKHIKDAPEEARGGEDHTYIIFGRMENSTTKNLKSKKNKSS